MKWRCLRWVLSVAALVALVWWACSGGRSDPLVAGKSVAWWLQNLTVQDSTGILRGDSPLAQAGPEIIPSLIHAIESPSSDGSLLSRRQQWVPAFLRKYIPKPKAAGYSIRTVAAIRLGVFGPAASNAVPCLTELLKKPLQYVDRGRVIQALGEIGPPARQAVPGLVEALTNQEEVMRSAAAQSLLQIGVVPREAIPALEQNLKCTDYIAARMAVAIWAAEPSPEALSRIQSMLTNSGYGATAAHTAAALRLLTEVPQELTPILTRMMDKDPASVRHGAALALARPHAENVKRIVEVLIEGVNQGEFRIPCAEALGNMGSDAIPAKAALQKAQLHPNEGYVISNAAARAFARIPAE